MSNQIKYIVRRVVLAYYAFRYSSYYAIVMPIFVIISGLLVFILFILPQLQNWFSVQGEVEALSGRISAMRQNSRILESMNKISVDRDFTTSVQALPGDKDFAGVLQAIGKASTMSNITLDDYEFSLGAVSVSKNGKKISPGSSPVLIGLTVEGNVRDITDFLFEIERKLPLAEVRNINFSENKGEILLVFHMKPLPDLAITYSDPIIPMTQEQRNILQALHQWAAQ